jgi:heat shock protein HslJ
MKRSIVLLAALALAGCAITSRDATTDLPGTSWVVVDIDGDAPVGETPPTIAFDDQGSVTGTGGCNTFSGEVSIEGSDLTFGPLASTQMACEGDVSDQEQAFFTALQGVTGYTIDNEGRLVLEGDDGSLTFEVAAEAE